MLLFQVSQRWSPFGYGCSACYAERAVDIYVSRAMIRDFEILGLSCLESNGHLQNQTVALDAERILQRVVPMIVVVGFFPGNFC